MKYLFTLLAVLIGMRLFASVPPANVVLNMNQACILVNDKPFQHSSEIHRFSLKVDPSSLPERQENVQQISIWADGRIFVIEEMTPQSVSTEDNGFSGAFIDNEALEFIKNAHFIKLQINYAASVDERKNAKEATTPYYTTIKTTVEKEEFLPLSLERAKIDEMLKECHSSISYEKTFQLFLEIAVASVLILMLSGVVYYRWKKKRRIS
ncbi:MAG: hypothetical protein AB7S65_05635 [Sulfuricurvum sp.]